MDRAHQVLAFFFPAFPQPIEITLPGCLLVLWAFIKAVLRHLRPSTSKADIERQNATGNAVATRAETVNRRRHQYGGTDVHRERDHIHQGALRQTIVTAGDAVYRSVANTLEVHPVDPRADEEAIWAIIDDVEYAKHVKRQEVICSADTTFDGMSISVAHHDYRVKASVETRLRNHAWDRSDAAEQAGKTAEAQWWSEKRKAHDKAKNAWNVKAAEEAFRIYNRPSASGMYNLKRCDLHGLHVSEATEYATNHINACRSAGVANTVFVTGWGNRSKGGVAKVKPAIMDLISRTEGLSAFEGIPNVGCVTVHIPVFK